MLVWGAMAAFSSLSERLTQTFASLRTKGKLSAADVDGTVRDIRRALLESDVALDVVKSFTATVRERALSDEVNQALNPAQQVVGIVNEELVAILGGDQRGLTFAKTPPTVIMLAGLQGSGKTTLAGKLSAWLKEKGHTPVLIACDLQRPGAVKQLGVVAEQAGVALFAPEPGDGVGDPVKVAKAGVAYAKDKNHDIAIVDTAGRLGVDAEMMKQAAAIRKATDPDEVLFVIDAMIEQGVRDDYIVLVGGAPSNPAYNRAGHHPVGRHCAPDTVSDARGARRRLYPYGPRQRYVSKPD